MHCLSCKRASRTVKILHDKYTPSTLYHFHKVLNVYVNCIFTFIIHSLFNILQANFTITKKRGVLLHTKNMSQSVLLILKGYSLKYIEKILRILFILMHFDKLCVISSMLIIRLYIIIGVYRHFNLVYKLVQNLTIGVD